MHVFRPAICLRVSEPRRAFAPVGKSAPVASPLGLRDERSRALREEANTTLGRAPPRSCSPERTSLRRRNSREVMSSYSYQSRCLFVTSRACNDPAERSQVRLSIRMKRRFGMPSSSHPGTSWIRSLAIGDVAKFRWLSRLRKTSPFFRLRGRPIDVLFCERSQMQTSLRTLPPHPSPLRQLAVWYDL